MPPTTWRRVVLAILPAVLCISLFQMDDTAATSRSQQGLMAPTPGPTLFPMESDQPAMSASLSSVPLQDLELGQPQVPGPELPMLRPPWDVSTRLSSQQDEPSDPVVQSEVGQASLPGPSRSFLGAGNIDNANRLGFFYWPPNSHGDVGANHYVQVVNRLLTIWNKNSPQPIVQLPINRLWNNSGYKDCERALDSQPIVLYDPLDGGHWLVSQRAMPDYPEGPYYQCLAVSLTNDPTGNYYRYKPFEISETKLHDYPQFGVWPDGYYMTFNQFTAVDDEFVWAGAGVAIFERQKMLRGEATRWIVGDFFGVNPNFNSMLPADLDGPPPPAGSPFYFAQVDNSTLGADDALYLWQARVNWSTSPATAAIGLEGSGQPNAVLATAPFNWLACVLQGTTKCIPQRGTSQKLAAEWGNLMYRLQYRNFGDHESLVVNHTVNAGGERAGVRWYEIRSPRTNPIIYQQGTYAPGGNEHRWTGSAAMDRQGNIAIGYSASGPNTYPSLRYAGRLVSDAPGTLGQGEATLHAGSGSQTDPSGAWGNSSMLAVDPVDDCTFWYTNEYYTATTTFLWQTRIGSFRLPGCTGAPTGHVFGTITNASTGAPVAKATVRAGAKTTTTNTAGQFRFYNLPVGTYNLAISASGYKAKTVNGLSVIDRRTLTQNSALQSVGGLPGSRVIRIPIVLRSLPRSPTPTPPRPPTPTPTPTLTPKPKCDALEPNDDRAINPFRLAFSQTYSAKFCPEDQQDTYVIANGTRNHVVQITIKLPPKLVNLVQLVIYNRQNLSQEICIDENANPILGAETTVRCPFPQPGDYVLRLYTIRDDRTIHDVQNPYTIRVDP